MTAEPLRVDAELTVEHEGRSYRVWTEEDALVVGAPSLSALLALSDLRRALPDPVVGDALDSLATRVEVRVRRATVARLGTGVDGGAVGRSLTGLDAALDPAGVAAAAVRALG